MTSLISSSTCPILTFYTFPESSDQMLIEEDINDVIEEENDDKVNVADDNEIKHKASLT